ncbi:MAG: magnesium chelatase ATPase subunit I [Pseudomonadota bacterium]
MDKTSTATIKPLYPFSAIVGQAEMKAAFLIAAVDPSIGGVLAFGDRGTGKSTAVRSLAALLPPIESRPGCPYNCDPARGAPDVACSACAAGNPPEPALRPTPVVDLPLGATEDRVVGALDLERALVKGEKAFQPGLLARAHRGFLYIDEVNLLEDHLIDVLLDAAASGENVVEREGLSLRHPCRFVLVGSGNPEEGELRPQLLDRFGLSVTVRTPAAVAERIEVVRRRDAFERDPEAFCAAWAEEDAATAARIVAARALVREVATPDAALEAIARLCVALGADGLRGELTCMRAARAAAALEGRVAIDLEDVRRAAGPALSHRLRRDPLDEAGSEARVARAVAEVLGGAEGAPTRG